MRDKPRGFTLIEFAISIAVFGVLIALGLPSFTSWINNTKIRTSAEGILNGVQLARAEAVRQNLSVQFVLGGSSGASAWTVNAINADGTLTQVQQRTSEGSGTSVVGTTPAAATTLTFNGVGRLLATNPPPGDSSAPLTQVDVCASAGMLSSDTRKMRILIGTAGNVKMCDPQVAAGDPRACPAGGTSAC
jgi:type IV fimbrial biogenesis protein FimT